MGKATRKKQAELESHEQSIISRLVVSHNGGKHIRGVVTAARKGIMTKALYTLNAHSIRPINDWVYTGKSKRIDKQRISLLRHLCGKYPVPAFLESPLIADDDTSMRVTASWDISATTNIIPWYVAVAQGKSLYKTCSSDILSKRETHLLLQAPSTLTFKAALWWAKTVAISNNRNDGYRLASSNFITHADITRAFWIDVHRFFANNPDGIKEMDELLDYIRSEERNNGWTIKKRSLESVRRKSEEWHRAQYKMKHIGGGSWSGMKDIITWNYKTGKLDTKLEWEVEQILTGNRLAKEGQRMRHCVASYKPACMEGRSAIFSMTSNDNVNVNHRNLTIEVQPANRIIVQAKGFANRSPTTTEQNVLNKWAMDNKLAARRW